MPDRRGYAARQTALLDSLMRGDGYPPGFGAAESDAAGRALRAKRGRAARQAWPALAVSLGADFDVRFEAYARIADAPADLGGLADGLGFAAWLVGEGRALTEDVVVELLLARALVRRRRGARSPGGRSGASAQVGRSGSAPGGRSGASGPARRRGVFVGARRLHTPPRLLVVVRAPGFGRRHVSLPLGRQLAREAAGDR